MLPKGWDEVAAYPRVRDPRITAAPAPVQSKATAVSSLQSEEARIKRFADETGQHGFGTSGMGRPWDLVQTTAEEAQPRKKRKAEIENGKKCWSCGGPHLLRNFPKPNTKAQPRTSQEERGATYAAAGGQRNEAESQDVKIDLMTKCLGLGLKEDPDYYRCLKWLWNQDYASLEREHGRLLSKILQIKVEPRTESEERSTL